jgi:hypothetical protein
MNGFISDGGFAERMLVDAPSFPPVFSNISPEVAYNHPAAGGREVVRSAFLEPSVRDRDGNAVQHWQRAATGGQRSDG